MHSLFVTLKYGNLSHRILRLGTYKQQTYGIGMLSFLLNEIKDFQKGTNDLLRTEMTTFYLCLIQIPG